MVLNLCDHGNQTNFSRIKRVFDDQALIVTPDDGGNRVVFACKGRSRWQEEHAGSILMKIKEFEYRGTL